MSEIKSKEDFFEGFVYAAPSISAYQYYLDVFIISLKDHTVVRFDAGEKRNEFRAWLNKHEIREAMDI